LILRARQLSFGGRSGSDSNLLLLVLARPTGCQNAHTAVGQIEFGVGDNVLCASGRFG